ncbi:MAG: DEAD/DEAH box helicase [Methylococcales bacterium]|nr:DEAD/DEAH box helicase [Methylococcales bacterium]
MPTQSFHPAIQSWFSKTFNAATDVQTQAWQSIIQGEHTLLAAPTGSGKTLAAFLNAIDSLIKEGLQHSLSHQTRVLYISPLKALSNDIQLNLQQPLQGIRDELLAMGLEGVEIKAWVRTGDTPQAERVKATKKPPHILVTTPESIYLLLTSDSGRNMLSTVQTVIVDEIHALAGNKRGSHLSLSLERLDALVSTIHPEQKLQRIGLSATQKPIETMAKFLIGQRKQPCSIIDTGHTLQRDLALDIPDSPLTALMSNEVWTEVYDKLAHYALHHKTILVFVNTRRLAERVARFIAERIGDEQVMAHHGSMAKEKRLDAEQRLKKGELKCLVATASLELGIDIGDIDLVCQLGSPRSIAAFLQRVGRSGHHVGGVPKGRIFPLSRDELVETTALLKAANDDQLDRVIIPHQPLDVLSQQIVAEVSAREWSVDALFDSFKSAWPYRDLSQKDFDAIIQMLSDGFSTQRGRRGAYLHYDGVNRLVRPRNNARIVALTNGGAIPDQFDCDVMLVPEGIKIGTIGEDFAFESIPGDIFQLGNNSYRMLKTETGKVFVEDAKGQPPNIPFWLGEAPGRTAELSLAVSELRRSVNEQLEKSKTTQQWLTHHYQISDAVADQLNHYLSTAKTILGLLPTQKNIVFERFFDEVGDMHLVIHSSYGSRINRAWGLALRKRFCRKFNFELQASALEDSIVLSLSSTHSFPLDEVSQYLNSNSVREVLIQALLDVPMFPTRWRWNATISLAVLRNRFGKRSPPYFQRSDAEDLVAILFPDQIACGENIAGDREVPDHPLVKQTIHDCLNETMDIEGLIQLLQGIEKGDITLTFCDLTSPSPLAQEIINARPYAFLDDGAAEERRTLAVKSQNFIQPEDAGRLRQLDSAAIEKVIEEAWPSVRSADELHDALMVLGFITQQEAENGKGQNVMDFGWQHYFKQLTENARATQFTISGGETIWVAAERLGQFQLLFPNAVFQPEISAVNFDTTLSKDEGLTDIIRSRLEGLGPVTLSQLAKPLGLESASIELALLSLEQQGFVVRGHFTDRGGETEWCERRLLARIHRYTQNRLRKEIEPVSRADFMRFLFQWQSLDEKMEGTDALLAILQQLEGYSIPAQLWQCDILPARINLYSSNLLESLTLSGQISWLRLNVVVNQDKQKTAPVRVAPIALVQRSNLDYWQQFSSTPNESEQNLSGYAKKIVSVIETKGALFFVDIVQQTGILKSQVEDALGELVNWGLVTSDSYAGLQALITPASKRPRSGARRGRRAAVSLFDNAGRWSLIQQQESPALLNEDDLNFIAMILLKRYGVVFKRILQRETKLPPWRDLLRVYWRLEARGEVRGGRFVEGISGEQFALPEALGALRKIRKSEKTGELVFLSSADPINLTGIILPGDKVAISSHTHIIFCNGVVVAVQNKNEIEYVEGLDESLIQQIEQKKRSFNLENSVKLRL